MVTTRIFNMLNMRSYHSIRRHICLWFRKALRMPGLRARILFSIGHLVPHEDAGGYQGRALPLSRLLRAAPGTYMYNSNVPLGSSDELNFCPQAHVTQKVDEFS